MLNTTGLLGSRAIVSFAGRFYSPVYGHQEWRRGVHESSCAIDCRYVPGERHQGCGFHAHKRISDTIAFVERIRGTADCIVLTEFFGRIALHENGLRAQKARIVAVADWNPREFVRSALKPPLYPSYTNVPLIAADYFSVPMLSADEAQAMIDKSWAAYQQNRDN